jgi:putative glycosyltransferase (TIGR04372 family)
VYSGFMRRFRKAIYNPHLLFRWVLNTTLIYGLGCPIAILIRALRPIIRIRFGRIYGPRIGHLIGTCDSYLYEHTLGKHRGCRDYFCFSGEPVNKTVVEMFARKMRFSKLAGIVDLASRKLPGSDLHIVPSTAVAVVPPIAVDHSGIYQKVPCYVELDRRIRGSGDVWLESIGITADKPLVLFANRDPVFLERIDSSTDWAYHDYRDCTLASFLPMAEAMVQKGYASIRVGSDAAESLSNSNPFLIDYASMDWSEERDLYLANRCYMFVATTSGIADYGRLFRKPTGMTNAVPFLTAVNFKAQPANLWIPKLFWSTEEKRLLTFCEMVEFGGGQVCRSEDYVSAKIELIENTAEEITDLAFEIEEIVEGRQIIDSDGEDLYRRFWDIVLKGRPWQGESTIALSFLRRHQDLLD